VARTLTGWDERGGRVGRLSGQKKRGNTCTAATGTKQRTAGGNVKKRGGMGVRTGQREGGGCARGGEGWGSERFKGGPEEAPAHPAKFLRSKKGCGKGRERWQGGKNLPRAGWDGNKTWTS